MSCGSWGWSTLCWLDPRAPAHGKNSQQPPLPSAEMSEKVKLGHGRNHCQERKEVEEKLLI